MTRLRPMAGVIAGLAWPITLPAAAATLARSEQSWAGIAFVIVALATAGLWWLHLRERRARIGLGGTLSGWLFIGAVALWGVSSYLWMIVAIAVIASALAYGVVLLATQTRAASPRRELATGLLLFAGAGASAMFSLTTGLGRLDDWWVPAHVILGLGIGAATVIGPTSPDAGT